MRNEKIHGFSLVELLAIVAILGTLIAVLSPAAAGYVRRGNIAKSANNLQQLSSLTILYATENDGRLPVYDTVNANYNWVSSLYKLAYGKEFPGFLPHATGENVKGTIFYSPLLRASEGAPLRSYAINQYLRNGSISPTQDNRIPLTQVDKPAKTLLFADTKNSSAVGAPQGMNYRNEGKCLVCFVDGHLESRKESEVPVVQSPEGMTFWLHE